jgi:hypothetical protein
MFQFKEIQTNNIKVFHLANGQIFIGTVEARKLFRVEVSFAIMFNHHAQYL